MATDSALRKALLAKLKVTRQALSQQVQKKRAQLPMTTEEATYIIAYEKGLKIHNYLSAEVVGQVRALQAQLRHASVGGDPGPSSGRAKHQSPTRKREVRFANKTRVTSSMLSAGKLAEAQEMATLYPILYVLENSMREVVKRVMGAKYGQNWWETQLVSGKLKSAYQTAAGRMKTESRQRWHQRRGDHPVDYVGLDELGDIIMGKHDVFFTDMLATDVDWFKHFMRELEPSRNVLCHMNPLSKTNARDLTTKLERWEALVVGSAIPAA
ncbi:MAG: Swt1 family HEPN domain-containing protein [Steroidobacteraceae bacterium]